ncbi:hypothetical protein V6L77_00670 [Pannonibacter sp. Pt2-lr]
MADSIADALKLPFREAIEFFLGKTNLPTTRWQDNYGRSNARAFSVAGAMCDDLIADFREEITRALTDGTTLEEFRTAFDDIVTRHGWEHGGSRLARPRDLRDQPLHRIFGRALCADDRAGDARCISVLGVRAFGARDPRPDHLAWDGLCLAADDPWWDTHYPPNGWGRGCRVRVLSRRGLARRGRQGPDQAPPIVRVPYSTRPPASGGWCLRASIRVLSTTRAKPGRMRHDIDRG